MLEGPEEPHDVRRAAGAAEPDAAAAGVVLLEVILAALQRVHVEEPLPLGGDRGGEAVVEHALDVVRVLRVAGGEQQPPAPLDAGDRGAGLVVGAVGRQLEPVAEALVGVPGAVAAGEVGLGRHHVVPAADRGLQQRAVAGLGGDVHHPGLQVQGPHHVPHLGVGGEHRHVVLQVAVAHAGVPGQAPPPLVDELPGQLEIGGGAGLAVELGQRRLDDRVPVQAPLLAAELADQVVGQAHGDGEQPVVAGAPVHRHGRLDQVTGAVHLVAPGQPGVPRLAADLEVGVQVAVGTLRLAEQGGDLGGEGGELGPPAVGQFPADGLQRLVDVGVHEHRAAVAGPGQRIDRPDADRAVAARGSVAIGLAGRLALGVGGSGRAGRPDRQPHVVEVPRVLELADRERQARGQVALLPLVQQPGRQPGPGDRLVRPGGGGGGGDGAGYATRRTLVRGLAQRWCDPDAAVGLVGVVSSGHYGRRLVGTVHVRGSMIQGIGFPYPHGIVG